MSELHKFIFEGKPVRGMLVRLTDAWQDILQRRAQSGGYPAAVTELLGEMTAAATLMQSNIKFNGALVMQIMGDGPVKLAVAEVQPDLSLRATATVTGEVAEDAPLSHMVNVNNQGKCAITLDPKDRKPGQQPYQGVVPLFGDKHEKLEKLSEVIEHYMLQSEQLDTKLVLAANDKVAAGLLIQRLPLQGSANLAGEGSTAGDEDRIGLSEDYNRISILASSLKREELLELDAETILHRLFWEEDVRRFEPQTGDLGPRFACSCSRERVGGMLRSLGSDEVESIIAEQGQVEVTCEFCGAVQRFDPVDAAQVFLDAERQQPAPPDVH
ncbi:Hsp33 chaperonin [Hydrogenophaga crassostreae]|uniref:Hsp33 chaperonin n=1 Tax=Hydrogenophaga crassostreae TaxID=1763535 RepID=A0A162SYX7_9BURK|nr:Hsp33 family molecular chaperone HslO [Hydrogenophaga crassostreae]AOW13765.1 Hsp33 chaperonin [Hydrogenophaga crassostreae]OAD44273.1 Hsp33 chaperonin [Hydrogenophaga crassostreae]